MRILVLSSFLSRQRVSAKFFRRHKAGANPLASAPYQRADAKYVAGDGKGQAEQFRYRQITDLNADPVFRDVDDRACYPWRVRRGNYKPGGTQINPDTPARAVFDTLSRHELPPRGNL